MALKAEKLFEMMTPHLEKNGEDFVKKLKAVYAFEIFKKKGDTPQVWTVDLKNGKGTMTKGRV